MCCDVLDIINNNLILFFEGKQNPGELLTY